MSKYILNSFQTPNAIIDDLMPVLTDSEFRVLMFLVREILGWSSSVESKRARISQSVMENGYTYTDKDGNEQVKPGCGVSIGTIRNALKALQKYRVIKKVGKPTNDGQMWELCLVTDSDPDIAGLKLRHETKSRKAKKQTEKARKTNPKNQGGSVQQIPHRGVSSTDSQGVSSTDTNETHRNTKETHISASDDATPDEPPQDDTSSEKPDESQVAPDEQAQPDKPDESDKLDKAARDEWYDAVVEVFDIYGGRNVDIQKMLRGEATKKGYKDYNLEVPIDVSQLREWKSYYVRTELNGDTSLNMVQSPAKIQSSIIGWQERKKKPHFDNRLQKRRPPANLHMLKTVEDKSA